MRRERIAIAAEAFGVHQVTLAPRAGFDVLLRGRAPEDMGGVCADRATINGMPENHFADDVARSYDADEARMFDPREVAVQLEMLCELAGNGPALEFAIGTGRIALPLAARGVEVSGIELSEAMVEQLRRKPGGNAIPVTIGDMAHARVDGSFALVYLVFNTIGNLTSQPEQIACFENAARHLRGGGCFVIEVGVPELRRLPPGERHVVFHADSDSWGIDEYDLATQGLVSHHFRQSATGLRHVAIPFRFVWPAELDLMARLAGMTLVARWADWNRQPFVHESTGHVSVWRKP